MKWMTGLIVAVLLVVLVGVGMMATAAPPQTAGQKLLAQQELTGKVRFQQMHYADSLAFILKHIERFRNAPDRTGAQIVAIGRIVAAFDVKTYSKERDATRFGLLKHELAMAKPLFTANQWKAFARPSVAVLAVGMTSARLSAAASEWCRCSSYDSWCDNGTCSANGTCGIWPWGCGTLLLSTCDGVCRNGEAGTCGQ
jgi:hypothetical protein